MSTIGAVDAQFGKRFQTMVCELTLGGFSGKIRGYPNHGKQMIFMGNLVGLGLEDKIGFTIDQSDSCNLFYHYDYQRGSALHRIKDTIKALAIVTQLFPIKITKLAPETFVYERNIDYQGCHEGQKLSDVMSAIWLGTGPAVGEGYRKPFWRDDEDVEIDSGTRIWSGSYKEKQTKVNIQYRLMDTGIMYFYFSPPKIYTDGLELVADERNYSEITCQIMPDIVENLTGVGFELMYGFAGALKVKIEFEKVPARSRVDMVSIIHQAFKLSHLIKN